MSAPDSLIFVPGDGISSLSRENLKAIQQTCDNYSELQSLTGSPGIQVYVRGAFQPSDGGQGVYYWSRFSNSPNDPPTVLAPFTGAPTGRWILLEGAEGFNGLIVASGASLVTGGFYAVRTSLGAFSGTLPVLSGVQPGSFLEIADADYNANVNNYTVNAFGMDQIAAFGSLGSSYVINLRDSITRFIANTTSWRAITK